MDMKYWYLKMAVFWAKENGLSIRRYFKHKKPPLKHMKFGYGVRTDKGMVEYNQKTKIRKLMFCIKREAFTR